LISSLAILSRACERIVHINEHKAVPARIFSQFRRFIDVGTALCGHEPRPWLLLHAVGELIGPARCRGVELSVDLPARLGIGLLDRPGRRHEQRQKAVAAAEALYAKWGRLAVFFTSTIISGILKMKYSQFVVWNFVVGAVYVLSVGPAAYGAGKVSSGEQDGGSLGALVAGLAIAAGCAALAARYFRRRKARRLLAGTTKASGNRQS
jgi:hypothetical protein